MKPRTVVLLALVVAALGAFIWFVERDLPSSEERAERSRKVLPVEPPTQNVHEPLGSNHPSE